MIRNFANSILTKVRDWLDNMIKSNDVSKALGVELQVDPTMWSALSLWRAMYQNRPPWKGEGEGYVKTLNLPAVISSKIAGNVTVEMQVKAEGSPRADFLSQQFISKVLPRLQEIVEKGQAQGAIIIKPFPRQEDISFDFIPASQFYPVSYDEDQNITGCIFVDRKRQGGFWFTRLEYHQMLPDSQYRIHNSAFRSSNEDTLGGRIPLKEVSDWTSLEDELMLEGVYKPLFGHYRLPAANHLVPGSPMGVACFSKSTDLIEQADRLWSDFLWEFESGRRALYVDSTTLDRDADDLPYLQSRRLHRKIASSGNIGDFKKLFEEWTPTLRETQILNGLDGILKRIELNCGLAFGSLVTNPQKVEMTATEIKSSRQETFLTITNNQKNLKAAIEDVFYATDIWTTLALPVAEGPYEVTVEFDDSIVSDKDVQFQKDLQVAGSGKMPDYMFLMRNYNLTKTEAKRWVLEARKEKADTMELFSSVSGEGQENEE